MPRGSENAFHIGAVLEADETIATLAFNDNDQMSSGRTGEATGSLSERSLLGTCSLRMIGGYRYSWPSRTP
jgi:hypothetical protein